MKEPQLVKVYRSLCVLADTPAPADVDREILEEAIRDFIGIAEPLTDHDLDDGAGRYELIARCRARDPYEPRRSDSPPVLIVDQEGHRFIRGGELQTYLHHQHTDLNNAQIPGRLATLGLERIKLEGREAPRHDDRPRAKNRMIVYRVPS